jgi:hypothetical protein
MREIPRNRGRSAAACHNPEPVGAAKFRFSRRPMAAACFLFFAASVDVAFAAPLPVTNCGDAGSGSLRASIASAASGDTVTIPSDLGCSKITLTTGALAVTQHDLNIQGPGESFTITGKYMMPGGDSTTEKDRIITHSGTGKLDIDGLTMTKGYLPTAGSALALGGCIYSAGTLVISNSTIALCSAISSLAYSAGGGVFARKGLNLSHSTVSYNTADSVSGNSSGGGIAVQGYFISKYNAIQYNTAGNSTTHRGTFGGFVSVNNLAAPTTQPYNIIGYTSIAGNSATQEIGGGGVIGNVGTLVDDVTVARNTSSGEIGGLYLQSYRLSLINSTIAFNSAVTASSYATGVVLARGGVGSQASMSSTIVSNNYLSTTEGPDVGALGVTIGGSNNLIYNPGAPVPGDTISGVCPWLGPLADNGGATPTIKLLGNSPAIDHGVNPMDLDYDGRGVGFPRSSGPPRRTAVPDIGAYEVKRTDEIFDNTFDARCPSLLP